MSVPQDIFFAVRQFRRSLGFTITVVLTLALVIGATTTIFSLVYGLWVDPYPYRDSDRIVNLSYYSKEGRRGTVMYSLADYLELRQSTKTLEDIVPLYQQIGHEVGNSYTFGYVSSKPEKDGSFRRIELRTSEPHLGLTQSRNGYYAK